ncbi:MAG: molybdopterin-dependent oxidoreductase, partial [Nitrospirota bacterium]
GIESMVVTANDRPLQESDCTFCGSCVDACPVNALLESDRWRKGREWDYEHMDSVCLLCGSGCSTTVSTKDGRIQKINAGSPVGSAERYICAYGRFGFDCIEAEIRLTSPLIKRDDGLKEATWDEALSLVAKKLKESGKDAGFISVAGIENEDALALRKLALDVVKTPNVDTTVSLYGDSDVFKKSQTGDIDKADVIVLVDVNPSQWERVLPALDAAVRRRVDRGAKLIVVNASDTKIGDVATMSLRGDMPAILKQLAAALVSKGLKTDRELAEFVKDSVITEEAEKAAALISEAKDVMIFSSPAMFDAAANIALIKGKVVAVPLESNAQGIALMGLTTEGKTYKDMTSGRVKILYAVGEVPLQKRPDTDFLIVQNSHMTELAKQADVVLPSATFLEAAGTMIDFMGRMKYLPKTIESQGEAKSHKDIFMALSKAMGKKMKTPTEAEVKKAMKAKMKLAFSPFERREGFDVSPDDFIESINASVINGSRLIWLKEAAKTAEAV